MKSYATRKGTRRRGSIESMFYIFQHFLIGPVPMKLRALPESFWKEPTSIQTVSHASSSYAVLPPLFSLESKNHGDVTCIRPVTPPGDKKNSPRHSPRSKKKIVAAANADTNLLFSLFDHLDTTNKIDQKLIVRRGR